jgi:hypothetical protein
MTDEMYVRSVWKRVEVSTFTGFSIALRPGNWPVDLQGFEKELVAWKYAAEFTRQRLKEIQQVEDEIRICEGCLRFWQEPLGTEYGGVIPMRRILARELRALAELKRGLRTEETQ